MEDATPSPSPSPSFFSTSNSWSRWDEGWILVSSKSLSNDWWVMDSSSSLTDDWKSHHDVDTHFKRRAKGYRAHASDHRVADVDHQTSWGDTFRTPHPFDHSIERLWFFCFQDNSTNTKSYIELVNTETLVQSYNNVTILLNTLEETDFYVRYPTILLLRTLLSNGKLLQVSHNTNTNTNTNKHTQEETRRKEERRRKKEGRDKEEEEGGSEECCCSLFITICSYFCRCLNCFALVRYKKASWRVRWLSPDWWSCWRTNANPFETVSIDRSIGFVVWMPSVCLSVTFGSDYSLTQTILHSQRLFYCWSTWRSTTKRYRRSSLSREVLMRKNSHQGSTWLTEIDCFQTSVRERLWDHRKRGNERRIDCRMWRPQLDH